MPKSNNSTASLDFEARLWAAADALRSNMDAAEYKHVALGLIFLKYISDAFEEHHARLQSEIRQQGYVLTPGRYVGAEAVEEDGEQFEQVMARLVAQLAEQTAQARRLDDVIARNLEELGYALPSQ
jgi:type I restriction-modification system DNA methylase subunit